MPSWYDQIGSQKEKQPTNVSYDDVQGFDCDNEQRPSLSKVVSGGRHSGNRVSFNDQGPTSKPSTFSFVEGFKSLVGLGGSKASAEETARALLFNESQKRLLKRAVELGDESSAEELAASLKIGWATEQEVPPLSPLSPKPKARVSDEARATAEVPVAQTNALRKLLDGAVLANTSMFSSLSAAVDRVSAAMNSKSNNNPPVAPDTPSYWSTGRPIVKSQSQPNLKTPKPPAKPQTETEVQTFDYVHSEDEDYKPRRRVSTPAAHITWRKSGAGSKI